MFRVFNVVEQQGKTVGYDIVDIDNPNRFKAVSKEELFNIISHNCVGNAKTYMRNGSPQIKVWGDVGKRQFVSFETILANAPFLNAQQKNLICQIVNPEMVKQYLNK